MTDNVTKIRALSWNVKGLRSDDKRNKIFKWLKEKSFHILMLQETFCTEDLEAEWKKEWEEEYRVWFSHHKSDAAGVALLIKKNVLKRVHGIHMDEAGRFIVMDCTIEKLRLILANIHGPSDNSSSAFHRYLFEKAVVFPTKSEIKYKTYIIGGVLNVFLDAKTDQEDEETVYMKESKEYIKTVMAEKNIIDIERNVYPNEPNYIPDGGDQQMSRSDYILVSSALKEKITDRKSETRALCFEMDLLTTEEVHLLSSLEELKSACKEEGLTFRREKPHTLFSAVADQLKMLKIETKAEDLEMDFKTQFEETEDDVYSNMAEMLQQYIMVVTISPKTDDRCKVIYGKPEYDRRKLCLGEVEGMCYQSLQSDDEEYSDASGGATAEDDPVNEMTTRVEALGIRKEEPDVTPGGNLEE